MSESKSEGYSLEEATSIYWEYCYRWNQRLHIGGTIGEMIHVLNHVRFNMVKPNRALRKSVDALLDDVVLNNVDPPDLDLEEEVEQQ